MTPRPLITLFCVTAVILTSCASTSPDTRADGSIIVAPYDGISRSAENVATGVGPIEWRAENVGRMWVGDDTLKRLLVNRPVRPGDIVVLDIPNNQLKLNDLVIYNHTFDGTHQHSVFFR